MKEKIHYSLKREFGFTREQKSTQVCISAIAVLASVPELMQMGLHEVGIINIVLNVMSSIIAYIVFREIFQEKYIALMCSALYVLSVYRIYLLYMADAREAVIFMMLLPLLVYGAYNVNTWRKERKYLPIIICMIGIVGLVIWYCAPIYNAYMNGEMQPKYMQQTGVTVAHLLFHFWERGEVTVWDKVTVTNSLPLGVGFVNMLSLFMFGVLWYSGKLNKHYQKGKICAAIGSIFMVLSLNMFPWNYLQKRFGVISYFLSRMESIDRLLTISVALLTIVFGYCLLWLKSQKGNWLYYLGIICGFVSITTSSMYLVDFICTFK